MFISRVAFLALVVGLIGGCQTEWVMRDGERLPYEQAAARDLERARAHLAEGELDAARRILEVSVAELSRSRRADEAYFLLGEVYKRQEENELAASSWKRLVERYPTSAYNAEAALRAALIYRDANRPEVGRQLLEDAAWNRADADLRARIHRLRADLARAAEDFPDAVVALAFSRRDASDPEQLREIDLELQELLETRVNAAQLEGLVDRVPRGPVYDRLNLTIARRALSRLDYDTARIALNRLPQRLQPAEEQERLRLEARVGGGEEAVGQVIGAALPLSGPYAAFGRDALGSISLALGLFDDPNATLRVLVGDTRGQVQRAPEVIAQLIEAGASAIIGPMRSPVAAAAAPVAELNGVPLLTLARRGDVPFLGDFIFRVGAATQQEVKSLVERFARGGGMRRFAILYPDDAYGREFKNAFWDEVEAVQGQIVGSEKYESDAVDWQNQIKKLVGLYPDYLTDEQSELLAERERLLRKPLENASRLSEQEMQELPPYVDFDALFIPDSADKIGLILPQLRFFDIEKIAFLGPSGWNDPQLVRIAGRQAAGSVFTSAFCPQSPQASVQTFVQRFRNAHGEEPNASAAQAYDAARLIRYHLERDVGITREQLRRRLIDTRNFDGVSGLVGFEANGDSVHRLCLLTVRRGKIEPL